MDYREEEVKDATIKMDIQETYKIMNEMKCVLNEFASVVNGKHQEEKTPKDASCMWEEARMLTALAYENLKQLIDIKSSII